ncbi:6-phosphofructo-2-kinase-domain-containing protein [Umbelopsis sp. AD052]|nr:6-phosphofructo-2-kinase-domain-containing protein [Umbelopsis sp. AD052]
MAARLYVTDSGRYFHAGAIAIITVGLPARGKTHVSRSLCRYLRWLGVPTKVFSVGNYRRQRLGTMPNDFFSPANEDTKEQRLLIAEACLKDMIEWLEKGGQVGIYDASNTTDERRAWIQRKLKEHDIQTLFIESICNKQEIIDSNIRSVKISSPDYVGWDPEAAVRDFKNRIENHLPYYKTIRDPELPFVKLMNVGEQLIVNNVKGYLQSRIVYYLMHLHIQPRIIYFARIPESLNESSYKADADLSPVGHKQAEALKTFIVNYRQQQLDMGIEEKLRPLTVWGSTRKHASQAVRHFAEDDILVRALPLLTERNPGECDGLTPQQIKAKFPEEFTKSQQDPYNHRYPRAEVIFLTSNPSYGFSAPMM